MQGRIYRPVLLAFALGGCMSTDADRVWTPTPPPDARAKITSDQLVGSWGLGAYHQDRDRPRTTAQAKALCGNPYVIKQDSTGALLMHVADSPELFELSIRLGPDGKTYLGPKDKAAGSQWDREILSNERGVVTASWVDPEVASRYGVSVFVRCSGRSA